MPALAAHAGELVAVIGPNGAGKSTLLRTLVGAQTPLAGDASLDGVSIAHLDRRERARRIAVVLTDRVDPGLLTVGDVVLLGRHPHTGFTGYVTPRDLEISRAAAERLGVRRALGSTLRGTLRRATPARASGPRPRPATARARAR